MEIQELNRESFQSCLHEDDVFVEYFNEFLQLPIFKGKMLWNAYKSMFEDVNDDGDSTVSVDDCEHYKQHVSTSELAAMDLLNIRDDNLKWIMKFRLPFFRRSLLYRQYKLYKVIQVKTSQKILNPDGHIAKTDKKRSVSTSKSVSLPPLTTKPDVLVRSHTYPTFDSDEVDDVFSASGRCSVLEFSNDSKLTDTDALTAVPVDIVELKRKYLHSAVQMSDFLDLLDSNTSSHHLLTLWMSIEKFKEKYNDHVKQARDVMAAGESLKDTKIKIFRFIQEKFRFQLTDEAMLLIMNGISEDEVALNLLLHGQTDILKRICEYWLPRYLLHFHFSGTPGEQIHDTRIRSGIRLFPSLSLVRSLPIHGEEVQAELKRRDYAEILRSTNCLSWKSGSERKTNAFPLLSCSVTNALLMERDAGSPFTHWLSRTENFQACDWLNFWLDVNDYMKYFNRTDDRFLKLSSLWQIFHRHLYEGTELGCTDVIDQIYTTLKTMKSIRKEVIGKLFKPLQDEVARRLEVFWKVYYDQDDFMFEISVENGNTKNELEFGNRSDMKNVVRHSTTSSSTTSRWVQKHPSTTDSERRLHTALSTAERFQQSSKRKQKDTHTREDENESSGDDDDDYDDEDEEEDDEDDFLYCLDNTSVLSKFKIFMENEEGRDALNSLHMYTEIDAYFSIKFDKRNQKQQTAMAIYKTFFDKSSRKSCHLPDILVENLHNERPTSPLLREAQQFVLPQLRQCYKTFKQYCCAPGATTQGMIARKGKRNKIGGTNSEAHLKKQGKSKPKGLQKNSMNNDRGKRRRASLRGAVTKEDRRKFMTLLSSDFKKHKHRIKSFRNYLLNCDSGGFARLEKDFLFCMEVTKFKELFSYLDEDSLQKKAEVIVDVFLDSASPPWIQVDVSPELASKTSQRFQQMFVLKSRSKDPGFFDEAMAMVLKELLPFWSGFTVSRKATVTQKEGTQLTREEKKQLRLYAEFKKYNTSNGPVDVKPGSPSDEGVRKSQLVFSLYKGSKWKKTFLGDVSSMN